MAEDGKERWGGGPVDGGAACVVDEVEDVSSLLTEGRVDGKDAFDEAAAVCGVRAVAGLATEHAVADGALGGVGRGRDALDGEERPASVGGSGRRERGAEGAPECHRRERLVAFDRDGLIHVSDHEAIPERRRQD